MKPNVAKEKSKLEDCSKPLINRKCSVKNCKNNSKTRQLLSFPGEKRLQWNDLLGLASCKRNRTLYICTDHFKKQDLMIVYEEDRVSFKLKNFAAIPSENLPTDTNPMELETVSAEPKETLSSLSEAALKFEDTIKEIDCYKKHKGSKYKDVQLNFYIANANAYKLLLKPFNLMEISELIQSLNSLKTLHQVIMKKLAVMSPRQKICILSQGNISMAPSVYYDDRSDKLLGFISSEFESTLPHLADLAQFLSLSGVYESWNLLFDISYSNYDGKKRKSHKNWFGGLGDIYGFTLRNIVKIVIVLPEIYVNQVTNNVFYPLKTNSAKTLISQLIESLNLDPNIIVLYNLQFLLMIVFYILRMYYYLVPRPNEMNKMEKVSLSHLTFLITVDATRKCPLISKLDVPPNGFDDLKFETVLEYFSKNTVIALRLYLELDLIPKEAEGTLIFVEKICLLIDIFRGNITDGNQILSTLRDVEIMFTKLMVYTNVSDVHIDPTHTPFSYFINALQTLTTLYKNSPKLFMALSKKLLNTYTNQFCETIRNKSRGEQPSVKIVNNLFKRRCLNNLLKPFDRIKVDLNDAIDIFIDQLRLVPNPIFANTETKPVLEQSEYRIYYSDRPDKLIYISGYILKKLSQRHSCGDFVNYLYNTTNSTIDSLSIDVANGECLMPKSDFIEFIELLEMMFVSNFRNVIFRSGIIKSLKTVLSQVKFKKPCVCFPMDYLLHLFLCIRIDHVIRCSNLEVKLRERLDLDPITIIDCFLSKE